MVLYQYFVEVVPTEVSTFLSRSYMYQYAVKDNMRLIDHHSGELSGKILLFCTILCQLILIHLYKTQNITNILNLSMECNVHCTSRRMRFRIPSLSVKYCSI